MKILVPSNAPFALDPAPEGVSVCLYDPDADVPAELLDADAAVVWGFAAANLRQFAQDMPNLRWVQAMTAGPDALLAAGLPERVEITVGRGFHDRTVTEHAVALTLAFTTDLWHYREAQRAHRWDGPGFRPLHAPDRLASIIGAQVLIWGFGSIGTTMARAFASLGARVRGVANSSGQRDGFAVYETADLAHLLQETDVLVMVLPNSPSTRLALDADRLALLKPTSLVINVGRGSTIDEAALADALHRRALGGAGLDVFATEPLPADSPLWDAPHTVLTPHAAGGRPLGVEEVVRRNLAHLMAGEPLELKAKG